MTIYMLPKGVIKLLDKIRRDFLWGGGEERNKIRWVKWDTVCKSKKEGGLGVRDLRTFNLALMGKWWGRLATSKECVLWRVLEAKYGNIGHNWVSWVSEGRNIGSLWWRDVCNINQVGSKKGWLENGFRLVVGEGKKVRFWRDLWAGDEVLANKYSRLFWLSTGQNNNISQMGCWKNGNWTWAFRWRRKLFTWEENQLLDLKTTIEAINLQQGKIDQWTWIYDKKGLYTAKSGYLLLKQHLGNVDGWPYNKLWIPSIPSKVSAFIWQTLQDKIATKWNLFRRGILNNNQLKCCFCDGQEDTNHLFLHCNFASKIWNLCLQWWGIASITAKEILEAFKQQFSLFKERSTTEGWITLWCSVLWAIWLARNEMIFRNRKANEVTVMELAQIRAFHWISGKSKLRRFDFNDWKLEPMLSMRK
ncbi:hypothetical protein SLA2020_216110 [Shorea laevis]